MFDSLSNKLQSAFKLLKGRGKLTEANIEESLKTVRLALLEADVNYKVVKDFISRVKERALGREVMESLSPGQQVVKIVHDELVSTMGPAESGLDLGGKPSVIMVAGLQGSGKTTACGKLARMLGEKGLKVFMIPADTRRPAAISQLKTLGDQAGASVHDTDPGSTPPEAVKPGIAAAGKAGADAVLIDTGGRLHIDEELMKELENIKKIAAPHELLLAVDAMTGQDAVNIASEFENRLGIDGVIMTKLDGDARGGAALSVRAVTGKPIKFASVGEKLDSLEDFHPDRIASRILGMGDVLTLVEKAEASISEAEKARWEQKIKKDGLSLEDLLEQLKMMKSMGSLEDIISMMPGGSKIPASAIDETRLSRFEAIIKSMTREERDNADIINGSRRRRIAEGSGTSLQDVNALLKQFMTAKKFMKKMSKSKIKGGAMKWL